MLELIEIKIGTQLTIHARQKIEVELFSIAFPVIVCTQEDIDVFFKVDSQEQPVTVIKIIPKIPQKQNASRPVKVADV